MVFSSLSFLIIFLPVVVALYYVAPGLRAKNSLLLIASLFFYSFGEPIYIGLLLVTTVINYIIARLITSSHYKKLFLGIGIGSDLLMLVLFKYLTFITVGLSSLGFQWNIHALAFPIGISFYTFQIISYIIDVYRKEVQVQKSFTKLLLYVCFFPQLIAGPIVKYHDIEKQFDSRVLSLDKLACGLRRFIVGLAKKVLIANSIGYIVDGLYELPIAQYNIIMAWSVALLYCLQIYYDFSGYSDMAIGLGQMFGFQIKENFMYPYEATTIKEFWKGWHISLSTWFKEYLYIPLGGNRLGKRRTVINKLIVFATTGLWHGAGAQFILWGLWHGLFATLEDQGTWIKKIQGRFTGWLYSVVVVSIGFVLFRSPTLSIAWEIIEKMFTGFQNNTIGTSRFISYFTPYAITMVLVGGIGVFNWKQKLVTILSKTGVQFGTYVVALMLYCVCVMSLVSSAYNPFIYFRF